MRRSLVSALTNCARVRAQSSSCSSFRLLSTDATNDTSIPPKSKVNERIRAVEDVLPSRSPRSPIYRAYNFSAGPACLPNNVMAQAQREFTNWGGSGMGIPTIYHSINH
jgi:hypothetical protein